MVIVIPAITTKTVAGMVVTVVMTLVFQAHPMTVVNLVLVMDHVKLPVDV
jgi:hypothetical protein